MVHTFIGDLGHFLVIFSFVTSLVATYSYYKSTKSTGVQELQWKRYARIVFYLHTIAVLGVVASLFYIIYNHYFEYHYAYSHSSRHLPTHYMISCFWEGQEGSFLLWIFWHCALGFILIQTNKFWEAPVMTVFSLVQAFLVSMILGVVIPGLNFKIGSDPFILLRDALQAPIFDINPNFIPGDGTGLNPLLQNYWMVIHPPTLFLGFAATLIPFAYCIGGLAMGKYHDWIRPALPWTLFAAMILGLGILMGGYWAYETLSFGGYWNWDPVENAVYIPWLVLVASYHTMITYKQSSTALKTSVVLVIATFILILYSTFLTRSGVLGDASVHSFTDLGLSGQLLLYLMAFIFLSIWLVVKSWKKMPSSKEEVSTYSREFWIFMGTATLCLMGFQVLIPTSIPVYNSVLQSFGIESNLAPPADQIAFYTKFQLWFSIVIAILSGTGQFFWWKKMDKKRLKESIITPIIIALLTASFVISVSKISQVSYMLLVTAGIYTIVANGQILIKLGRSNLKLTGGSIAHMGVGLILIGILYSSGYSKIISINNTGLRLFNNSTEEMDRENVLLWLNEPRKMQNYQLQYRGDRVEVEGLPGYIKAENISPTNDPYKAIANEDIVIDDHKYFSKGDTVEISPENTYYEVEYVKENGQRFNLYPRAQINPQMGGLLASPDIRRGLSKDLYTHVSAVPNPEEELSWETGKSFTIKIGEQFFHDDFKIKLKAVKRMQAVPGITLGQGDVAIKAELEINDHGQIYTAEPVYIIKNQLVGRPPETMKDIGLKITFMNVLPENDSFVFQVDTSQKNWIIMKAIEKPLINILWFGTLIMILGFVVAINRRYDEFKKMRQKGIE